MYSIIKLFTFFLFTYLLFFCVYVSFNVIRSFGCQIWVTSSGDNDMGTYPILVLLLEWFSFFSFCFYFKFDVSSIQYFLKDFFFILIILFLTNFEIIFILRYYLLPVFYKLLFFIFLWLAMKKLNLVIKHFLHYFCFTLHIEESSNFLFISFFFFSASLFLAFFFFFVK